MSVYAQPASYHLRLLGPIQIERNGHPIGRLESRKALGLLCYLCSQSKPLPRSHLAALFWADKPEARGRGNLSRVLHSISQELPGCLEADRHAVQFRHHEQFWVDTVNFDHLAASRQIHLMAAATELYRGEFLEDLMVKGCPEFDLWVTAERERWRQRMAQLFQTVIGHHMERGEYEQGLRYASRLLALDPLREEVHRQKMLLHHLNGQRTAALAQFDRCRQILALELGVEPSPETLALRQQIEEVNTVLSTSAQPRPVRVPLLDRGEEHTWLVRGWEDARRGLGKFTLVEGAPGVGKTALIEEVLAYAAGHGARVLRSRCYGYGNGLTYEAFVNALRPLFDSHDDLLARINLADSWIAELVRLWPEVGRELPSVPLFPDEETTARHRLFEAIAQLLMGTIAHSSAVILFLDDLHEADQPSLDLLRYLYHRLRSRAIWFICAYRRQETTPNHPLTLFRNVLTREGHLATLTLAPLSGETILHMLSRYNGLSAAQIRTLGHFLQKESEGNPFVLEQVRQGLQDAQILNESEGHWRVDEDRFEAVRQSGLTVPDAVVAMQANRLARLSPRARRLLQLAAAIGREFDLALLMHAAGEPEDWVEICLASWMARGLVEETPPHANPTPEEQPLASPPARLPTGGGRRIPHHCYRFSHVMLWRVVLAELTPLQRLRMDERIAAARAAGPAAPRRAIRRHVEELGG